MIRFSRWKATVGLFAATAQRPFAAVHKLHSVEESRDRGVQNCRSSRTGSTLGHPEKPPLDELRQDEQGAALLLSRQHPQESSRRTSLLPVSIHVHSYVKDVIAKCPKLEK